MSRVLVGVDGSEDSRIALRWAATLADAWGVPLRALRAWQYPAGAMLSSGSHDLPDPCDADELVEEQLRRLVADELGEGRSNVTVEAGRGPGAAALLRAATQGPRMVVVGSRGLGGFKGLLLGSVSQQLCEHAPCPVTVVRRMAPVQPVRFETIVVGIDGSVDAARALRFAADLATKVGAALVVANAAGPGDVVHPRGIESSADLEARRERVATWCAPLEASGFGFRTIVVRGDARTALLDIAREESADLLVVGSRGRGLVTQLLLGSVASSLTRHGELPVTVVPHARQA